MPEIVFETKAGTLWWHEDGFWHFRMNEHYEISADEMHAFLDTVEQRSSGQKAPLLIDRSFSYSPSFGAWQAFRERAASLISTVAYYVPTDHAASASAFVREHFLAEWESVALFREMGQALVWLRRQAKNAANHSRGIAKT